LRDNQLGKDEAIDHYQDLYQVNYEEGHRALDDQQDELNGIRDRAVQFTVFVGAATAFLVGSGLQSPHRDAFFYAIAWVASAASALSVSLLFLVLNPSRRNKWAYRLSTKVLNRELEADAPTSKAYYFKKMAGMYDEMRESNEILLRSMVSIRKSRDWACQRAA
jgi:hypothetical protein